MVHQPNPNSSTNDKNGHLGAPDTLDPNPQEALAFVSRVFRPSPEGDLPGHLLLWVADNGTSPPKNRSYWFRNTGDLAVFLETQKVPLSRQEVYVGMALAAPDAKKGNAAGELGPHNRLKQFPKADPKTGAALQTAHFIPGLWADLDYGQDGHKASDNGMVYPPDQDTVMSKLQTCPLQPSELVHSGHGIQAYWLLPEIWDISADLEGARDFLSRWLQLLRARFAPHDLDAVHDLARLMRLPGFINNKNPAAPKRVRSLLSGGPIHTVADVKALLPGRTTEYARPQPARTPVQEFEYDPQAASAGMRFIASYENCAQFRAAWDGNRPDMDDQSPSGYDMALADAAAYMEWGREEIVELLVARRRKSGASEKPAQYFTTTAGKALEFAREKAAAEEKSKEKSKLKSKLKDWFQFGDWIGQQLKTQHRYDSLRREWWVWRETHWQQEEETLPGSIDNFLRLNRERLDAGLAGVSATFEGKDGEPVRVLRLTEKNLNIHKNLGILSGLRHACDRPFPDYVADQKARDVRSKTLAVPSGVVNLDTGRIEPHDPLKHDTKAVTVGDYRPEQAERLAEILRGRFRLVFDDDVYQIFLIYLGMTVSGQGQSYRSIILCLGADGRGKGGTADLIAAAWGGRAATLPMSMLERSTQEIDSTRYAIMRDQPLFLILDENGNINTSTLNHISGKNHLAAARLPYMPKAYSDTIPSVIWWATTETPALKRKTGIDRRLGFIPFNYKIAEKDKDASQSFAQELLDAMVTVGIQQAIRWRKRKIKDPHCQPPELLLDDMDPVQAALDGLDPEEWNGRLVSVARDYITATTGDRTITATSFGNAVRLNGLWTKRKETKSRELRGKWILVLK